MIKASVFADLQTGRKMSCPWNPSLFAHSGSAQLYEYCMFKMFVLKMEQKKKRKKEEKNSTALPRMWPRHTTITQTIWWNICFRFHSWSCISCECCGWWEVQPICGCVMANENIVAPLYRGQTFMYCTYGCRGTTILHHDVRLSWQESEHSLLWSCGKHLGPPPPLGLFKQGSMLNSYNLICSLYKYTPRHSHTIKQTCRLHLVSRTYLS